MKKIPNGLHLHMTIPISYYFQFWCKGTILALGTGALLALLVPPLIAISPYFIFIAVIVYQIFVCKYFWGNRRGDFEYKYKEMVLKKGCLNSYLTLLDLSAI